MSTNLFSPEEKLAAIKRLIAGESAYSIGREYRTCGRNIVEWNKRYMADPDAFFRKSVTYMKSEKKRLLRRIEMAEAQIEFARTAINALGISSEDKYAAVKENGHIVGILAGCKLLNYTIDKYHYQAKRSGCFRQRNNRELLKEIRKIYEAGGQAYGRNRIQHILRESGVHASGKRISRLMNEAGLILKRRGKRFKYYRQKPEKRKPAPFPNLLQRNFHSEQVNSIWASDITYIWTNEGWLYLCCIIDLFSRRIVGWAAGARMGTSLAITTLENAIKERRPTGQLIFHTDQGKQYSSRAFQKAAVQYGITQSMNRKGCPDDNACAESFFNTLKIECVKRYDFLTRQEAQEVVAQYLHFYNYSRIHSALGYVSPAEYEAACAPSQDVCARIIYGTAMPMERYDI